MIETGLHQAAACSAANLICPTRALHRLQQQVTGQVLVVAIGDYSQHLAVCESLSIGICCTALLVTYFHIGLGPVAAQHSQHDLDLCNGV